MYKIYACSLMAVREGIVNHVPFASQAENKNEATGIALIRCREEYPMNDGYYGHSVSVVKIPLCWYIDDTD